MPRPEIDWRAVRFDYETTPLSLDKLCEKHGIPWKTTLRRTIVKQSWHRQSGEIAARLAILAVAGIEEEDPSPPSAGVADVPPPEKKTAPPPRQATKSAPGRAASGPVASSAMGDPNEGEILTARALARLHTERIRAQMSLAAEIQEAGMRVLRHISAYLDAPLDATDDASMLALQQRVSRLVGANPDRETLAGLLRAASDVVQRGVTIERHAIGMDTIRGELPNDPAQSVPESARNHTAVQLLKAIDMDAGMKLRNWAKQVLEERRSGLTIEGTSG